MKRRRNRETDSFTVSFLDVASCGFGAMIILLMITKSQAPITIEFAEVTPEASITELQEQLFAIRGETTILNRELNAKHEQLSALTDRIARLRRDLNDVEGRFNASNQLSDETTDEIGRLAIARQSLTAEMQRLLADVQAPDNNAIGGVPVDSEYIIFIIDTSGSMYNTPGNWNKMLEVIDNTLDVYPEVKGIQVMNDMGDYMFNSYRGEWIPDTPGMRNTILQTLRTWQPYSNSSPVEGVTRAINSFYSQDSKISIYVLGDDFQPGGSIQNVLQTIDRINVEDANGDRLVRIHGIGFPTIFAQPRRFQQSVYRYTTLMREMTSRNGGTFVGLNDFQ
ncbi:MAG: VWA domain-containing protein [Proteobacteria bacterium]|nr:VWA domain-containing protein [Pseudomonadota bacterium]MDA0928263.1 VWA domain-containing protein [Pseudomonadota bacterium]